MKRRFTIYTDGAVSGNPGGPGGWAAIRLEDGAATVETAGYDLDATNNTMEMQAVVSGLNAAPANSIITLVSDSEYVVKGWNDWLDGWIEKGWPSRIKNRDLWEDIISAVERHFSVVFVHVRGHGKTPGSPHNPFNDRADRLAGDQKMIAKELAAK